MTQIDELVKRARECRHVSQVSVNPCKLANDLADALESQYAELTRLRERNAELEKERDEALPWKMFYGEGKTLGEVASYFGESIYAFSPWLTAPLARCAAESATSTFARIASLEATVREGERKARADRDSLRAKLEEVEARNKDAEASDMALRSDIDDRDAWIQEADAKLDRAKEALEPLIKAASRLAVAAQTTGGVAGRDEGLCAEIDRIARLLGEARAVLSELSADAPAQQTQRDVITRDRDIILQALVEYDAWMLDDDYNATKALHTIMKRMRDRALVAPAQQNDPLIPKDEFAQIERDRERER